MEKGFCQEEGHRKGRQSWKVNAEMENVGRDGEWTVQASGAIQSHEVSQLVDGHKLPA